ncbi:hypothetical protein INR49_032437, partial [Caranx melampygus]
QQPPSSSSSSSASSSSTSSSSSSSPPGPRLSARSGREFRLPRPLLGGVLDLQLGVSVSVGLVSTAEHGVAASLWIRRCFLCTVCQDYIMPENKSCPLLQPVRTNDKKKKKKTRKKDTASATSTENTQGPPTVSLHPENFQVSLLTPQSPGQPQGQLPGLRPASKKSGERLAGSSSMRRRRRRRKKQPKDSPARLTATNKTSGCGAPALGYQSEPSTTQARESLRWEGVLEDPQAEEKRLELYRANRRQRYIAQREALLEETRDALRQTFPTEITESEPGQQEN